MRTVNAQTYYALLHDDGSIHYPYTKYLTDRFHNPHTREQVAQSLRVLYRFLNSEKIELALRALDGRCLSYQEAMTLIELVYHPIPEIEALRNRNVTLLTGKKSGKYRKNQADAVEVNTALKRLVNISNFLQYHRETILEPHIISTAIRDELRSSYDKTVRQLRSAISGTPQSHHLSIKSLPGDKYLAIIEAVVLRPSELYLTESGRVSRPILRHRAMTLLAAEGLRPGTLGNIALADFRPRSRSLVIKDNRHRRSEAVTSGTPKLKLGDSRLVNSASETMITLWPITIRAIEDYIADERELMLAKALKNKSDGFLFLNEKGGSIKHRSSITDMFKQLGQQLKALGLLDVSNDLYFEDNEYYDFCGYVMRHSAASFYLATRIEEVWNEQGSGNTKLNVNIPDRILDEMKFRFGWTLQSSMPQLYANRALSEKANVLLMDFNKRLQDAALAIQKCGEAKDGK